MSQENVDVLRKPLRAHQRSSRTLDQRLFLRFPRLADRYLRVIGRLPPSSRLRQVAVWRGARLAVEAFNRRDFDALLAGYHPDFELHPAREFVDAGLFEPCYRGRRGYLEFVAGWYEVWGAEIRVEPVELIDLGDRLVGLGRTPARAQASGVALTEAYGAVATLKDGKIIRYQEFPNHAEALEAVGLSE